MLSECRTAAKGSHGRARGGDEVDHRYYLEQALLEAIQAQQEGQIPIGCVIADEDGRIIALGHNRIDELNDPTAHEEMLAIRAAVPLW
jgi:tRNA(adenine34) deaminase